ncbi:MAG: hypothetical protein IT374_22090 [Polyangiaceae bacterium]|nr:hypothetical protein [Polyangiaceae bacterium]
MAPPTFDPTHAVTFDLASGRVHLEDAPARVLVPADALAALASAAGDDAARALGAAMGAPAGRRAARRLGDASAATLAAWVEHLGGELALLGLGSLGVERWGSALVLTFDHCALGDALAAAVLASAFDAATGKPVQVVPLARDATRARFLVTGAAGADKARGWLAEGVSWGDVLVRLHAGGAA